MRIIGGRFKGRRFRPPADKWPTRPTTDFSKEALFNILENRLRFDQISMLDLFGGTGNHSYEAISRGCEDVTYVDKFRPAVSYVRKLSKELDIERRITIQQQDVARFINDTQRSYHYIFAGPPYPLPWLNSIPERIFNKSLLRKGGLFVLEHNQHHDFEQHPHFEQIRRYGGTHFSFFTLEDPIAK